MSIKKSKLTESDLNRIVRKVIQEQQNPIQAVANNLGLGQAYDTVSNAVRTGATSWGGALKSAVTGGGISALLNKFSGQQRQRIESIANTLNSLQTKPVVDSVIVTTKYPQINGMTWSQFVTQYKVTPETIQQAKSMAYDMKPQQPQGAVAKPKPTGVKKPVNSPQPTAAAPAQLSPEQLKRIEAQNPYGKALGEGFSAIRGVIDRIGQDRLIPVVADALVSIQKKPINKRVIVDPKNAYNGKTWSEYVKLFKVTPEEIQNAKAVAYDMKQNAMKQPQKPAARPTQGGVKKTVKPTAPAQPAAPAQLSPEQLKRIEAQNPYGQRPQSGGMFESRKKS